MAPSCIKGCVLFLSIYLQHSSPGESHLLRWVRCNGELWVRSAVQSGHWVYYRMYSIRMNEATVLDEHCVPDGFQPFHGAAETLPPPLPMEEGCSLAHHTGLLDRWLWFCSALITVAQLQETQSSLCLSQLSVLHFHLPKSFILPFTSIFLFSFSSQCCFHCGQEGL